MQCPPDITKARDLLGWGPIIPLDESLGRTIAWFERLVRGKDA
jgi:nucleoside-diphosphate-sugar epimerase